MDKNLKEIEKRKKKCLAVALILLVMFVAGIPGIVLGAVYGIGVLLGISIACVVLGFYGAPVAFVKFDALRNKYRIAEAITEEQIDSVDELSSHFGIKQKFVQNTIREMISAGMLKGYVFDGQTLSIREKQNKNASVVGKCPQCGANMIVVDNTVKCEYCEYVKKTI